MNANHKYSGVSPATSVIFRLTSAFSVLVGGCGNGPVEYVIFSWSRLVFTDHTWS